MQTYKEYAPTQFDTKGLNASEHDISDWLVMPECKTRDASVLSESNFKCILERLGGESETVQVHSFGHWACGWFELILVHPSRISEAERIERALDEYPIIDEDAYSEKCEEERNQFWCTLSISERVNMCRDAEISIFAARHSWCPSRDNGESLLESIA